MRQLILASGSVYRLQLLQQNGYAVTAVTSGVDEPDLLGSPDLGAGLMHLAQRKARAVAQMGYQGWILGADTLSLAGGQLLGKPKDRDDARGMLQALSGADHAVWTGWCLLRTTDGIALTGVEQTDISMRAWSESEIQSYLEGGEWEGKCGAYGLQLPTDPFVTRLRGSVWNVIGIPLETLERVWSEFIGEER